MLTLLWRAWGVERVERSTDSGGRCSFTDRDWTEFGFVRGTFRLAGWREKCLCMRMRACVARVCVFEREREGKEGNMELYVHINH